MGATLLVPIKSASSRTSATPKEYIEMRFSAWIVRISVTAALVAGSAFGAGWKWDRVLPPLF
jgi:hypothetical protein